MRTLKPIALLATLAFALLAVGASGAGGAEAVAAKGARLQAFGSCGELLAYVKRHTTPLVGPYGLGGGLVKAMPVGAPTAARDAGGATTNDFSTTNVQEEGVDEPDMVKSNGFHLFTVRGDRLFAVDVAREPPAPRRLAPARAGLQPRAPPLRTAAARHLARRRWASCRQPGALRMIAPIAPSRTLLTEVDVGNPAALRVVRTFSVEADYVSARLVGGTVRIVTSSQIPRQLQFENPAGTDPQAVAAATAHNRAVVASSRVKSWLPTYVVKNRRTRRDAHPLARPVPRRCSVRRRSRGSAW